MSDSLKPIAVTCGDPAGIGPEVIAACLREEPELAKELFLIGPGGWLESMGVRGEVVGEGVGATGGEARSLKLHAADVSARMALAAMQKAADGCREGRFRAVVTGPVSKGALQKVGFVHPGQTEFYAACWGGRPTMAFVGERMRLVLATWHIPLREVIPALEKDPGLLATAVERADWLARRLGSEMPKIAVCGVNPHAGEGGMLGDEEQRWLNPQLDKLRGNFPGLSTAQPADTVFMRHLRGEFDVVVALYHDQGLAPLKTVEFDSAVNVTLGLPFIRTSPDHGTAFGIAGKGIADHGSMRAAIELARRLSALPG